ncbi:extensin-like isoform X2 [Penaeus japonicus]|nr:extensin-like isoform X2 [Penaeus japonicus]
MTAAKGGSSRVGVGGRGRLVCRARASPPPTFSWSTQKGALITNSSKYTLLPPMLEDDLVQWRSVLEVNEVVLSDYSVYRCAARNDLGGDMVVLALRPPARPLPPTNFTIVNATETSLTVSWTPSYDEGTPEGYTLQYKAEGTRGFQSLEIEGGETTEATLTGLSSSTEYKVVLRAKNDHGDSDHLAITTRTRGRGDKATPAPRKTRMVFVLMTICGLILLILNVLIIACIFRRRRRRRARASARARGKSSSEPPGPCEESDGFLPLKTRTPSGSVQCQSECRDDPEDCEHTSLMEPASPPGASAKASHRSSADSHLGKTPPREDSNLPQNGGVPTKQSPARGRRRKGRSTQSDLSPDVHEEGSCPAPRPAALYGSLESAAHVLPFTASRHVHSHTHSCIIHSPQEQPPHHHAPVFVPSAFLGRDFAQTLPGRQYVCHDHQRRQYHGQGQQDRKQECQAQSAKAYPHGLHPPYQGEYQAQPMDYQEQQSAYQGPQEAYQRQCQPQYQAQPDKQQPQAPTTDSPSRQRQLLPQDIPAAQQTYLESYGLGSTNGALLEDPSYQFPSERDPVDVLMQEDQTASFLETLQRPPEPFADPTSFDHPVYFLPANPEGHGPPLLPPALPPKDRQFSLPPAPHETYPARPLSYYYPRTPPEQARPQSSGRSPSQSRPSPLSSKPEPRPPPPSPKSQSQHHPPPSPSHRHPTPPTPRELRRPSPPTPKTPTSRRPSPTPKSKRPHQPPESPNQARPPPTPGQSRPPPTPGQSRPPPSPKQRGQPARVAPSPKTERRRMSLASSQQLFRSRVAFKQTTPSPPPPPPPPPPLPPAPPSSGQFTRRPRFPDDFLWQRGVGRTPGQEGKDALEGGIPTTPNRTR